LHRQAIAVHQRVNLARQAPSYETFDVASDTGTGVDDSDYQVPFAFTGKIAKLNIKLDRPKLSAAEIKLLETESQRNNRKSE
jgi:hypothetical protein